MREINSTNNEYIKYLFKLKEKKYRILEDKFLIEGYHLVEEKLCISCQMLEK